MEEAKGTIAFTTSGRPDYGFGIFSVKLPSTLSGNLTEELTERRLTDGTSNNFNGQFVEENEGIITYISERTGSAQIFLTRTENPEPEQLQTIPESLFHDRPVIKNGRLIYVSAHEKPDVSFKSWSAVYETQLDVQTTVRLTPRGVVDYSPSISKSGKFIAVASYEYRSWNRDMNVLETDIVVFPLADPTQRKIVCKNGGWPTWSGDSTIFFHRVAEEGSWSIFRVDLSGTFEPSNEQRITPYGLPCFTPSASEDGKYIAFAVFTISDFNYKRHIEIFDLGTESFHKVTALLHPNYDHYNPFFSPKSGFLGYHRFRGKSDSVDTMIHRVEFVTSPVKELRMVRINEEFPLFSDDGEFGVRKSYDPEYDDQPDGSKKWTVIKPRTTLSNYWSTLDKGLIYVSLIESTNKTVQVARVSFDPSYVNILTSEDSGYTAFPSCSPDGKHIVFQSDRSGNKNLWILYAVNGEIRQLTEGPWIDTMPSWSPDGELIAFSSNRHNLDGDECYSLYLIRPDGTDLRRVHVAGPEGSDVVDRERIYHVCFSSDSKWLLFTATLGGVPAEPVSIPNGFEFYGDLYVVRLDGSGLQRLTWNGYENGTPAWLSGSHMDLGTLSLVIENVGDKLKGHFDDQF